MEVNNIEQIIITKKLIEGFAVQLRMDEKSKNTIEKYVRDITAFEHFIGGKPVSKELALEYKENLLANGYAVSSINSMIASLNSFFIYVGLDNIKIKNIKQQRKLFCPEDKELTKGEYNLLISAAANNGNRKLNLIIQTICGTGIRVSELEFITVEAEKRGEAVVYCKGKRRTVFIVKKLQTKLLQYAKDEGIRSGSIFITRTGRPVSRTNIWRDMKKALQRRKSKSR